jgi:hypothetical protein
MTLWVRGADSWLKVQVLRLRGFATLLRMTKFWVDLRQSSWRFATSVRRGAEAPLYLKGNGKIVCRVIEMKAFGDVG